MREHGKRKRRGEQRFFTDAYLKGLEAPGIEPETKAGKPYKRAERAARGEGRLLVRVQPAKPGRATEAVKEMFYRYRVNGQDSTISLGRFDPKGQNGKTLAAIRADLRGKRELQDRTGDVKAHLKAEAHRAEVEGRKGSFRQLLAAYVESLRAAGKPSAKEAEGIFRRHVIGGKQRSGKTVPAPLPDLADKKANEIEPGDIQRILAKMVKADIGRQVNITRAYLRAAFAFGGKADHDPRTVAADGVLFGLKGNPVTLVPTIKEYERTGERTLDVDELRHYWKALEVLPMAQAATLRFNLALACQRGSQLLRADWADFDLAGKTLLLRDTKGRGGSRDHLLPLTPFALEQLKPLQKMNGAKPAAGEKQSPPFSSDGKRRIVINTLSHCVRDVSKALKKSKSIPKFQARDLRRTAETMLQKLGVDKEVRAHLLSHGRSVGVQGRHYERYDFLPEKRAALEKWARHLERIITGKGAKVVQLSERKA